MFFLPGYERSSCYVSHEGGSSLELELLDMFGGGDWATKIDWKGFGGKKKLQ